ncbi:MAG: hypothetical protein ACKPFB_11365, partial [Planktothrix sp.]
MTTYGVDVQVETQTKRPLKIDTSPGGKISRTTRTNNTGNYGNNSSYRPPQSATQARRIDGSGNYGNPMRTHVNVTATEVPGSKRQTLGNRARVASSNASSGLGKAAKTAGKIAKTVGGKISPGVGINAKGDIDFGLRAGGAGLSISGKGDISLGVPGLSATINPKNPTDTTVDIGFGAITIEQTRVGCSIIVTIKMGGKIINQETRKADDCKEPEPTPEPTPTPTPRPNPSPNPPPDVPKSGGNTTVRPAKPGYRYKWVWTTERSGIKPGSYRYLYNYDGVNHNDPSFWNPQDDPIIASEGDYIEEAFNYLYLDYVTLSNNNYDGTWTIGSVDSPKILPGASLKFFRSLFYCKKDGTRLVQITTGGFLVAY